MTNLILFLFPLLCEHCLISFSIFSLFFLFSQSIFILCECYLVGAGLGIGLGISAVFADFPALFQVLFDYDKSLWLAYISVIGMNVAATFGILNLAGILVLPFALDYGMPTAIVDLAAMTIDLIIGSSK